MPHTPSKSGLAKVGPVSAADGRSSDRRGATRYPFIASVEVVEFESEARLVGRVSDLARGGCYVDIINPLPSGTRVKLRIYKENENFEAVGTVRHSQTGMGMGIAFEEVTPEQDKLLQGWLARLSEE